MKYETGKLIEDLAWNRRKILGVCGKVYHLSKRAHRNAFSFTATEEELDSLGYVELGCATARDEMSPKNKSFPPDQTPVKVRDRTDQKWKVRVSTGDQSDCTEGVIACYESGYFSGAPLKWLYWEEI